MGGQPEHAVVWNTEIQKIDVIRDADFDVLNWIYKMHHPKKKPYSGAALSQLQEESRLAYKIEHGICVIHSPHLLAEYFATCAVTLLNDPYVKSPNVVPSWFFQTLFDFKYCHKLDCSNLQETLDQVKLSGKKEYDNLHKLFSDELNHAPEARYSWGAKISKFNPF